MSTYDQYLSYTGFSKYCECPQSYYLEYIERKRPKVEDQRNTLNGNSMHSLLEEYIERGKNETSWLSDNIDRVWNETLEKSNVLWKHDDDARDLLIKVRGWTATLEGILDRSGLDVRTCEAELKADTIVRVGQFNVKMGARLDIVRKDEYNNYMFLDLKASENKAIMKLDQIVWYSIVLGEYLGDTSQPKSGGYLLPGFDSLKVYKVTDEAKEKLLLRLEEVVRRIKAEIWTPDPDDKKCWWCPVKYVCPAKGALVPHGSGVIHLG